MRYRRATVLLLFSALVCCGNCHPTTKAKDSEADPEDAEEQLVKRIVTECTQSRTRIACFSEKAAKALERSFGKDIELFDGVKFARTKEEVQTHQARSQSSSQSLTGFSRFTAALANFLNTHTLTVDLTKDEEPRSGGEEDKKKQKELKKEKKYSRYAFMVLLGIFGLTGPLVMKTLAVMAAKALIASKIALIIVGSVALKKIFEKDHNGKSSVKVHTITTDDEHDRVYNSPYWAYEPYLKPT